MAQTVQWNPLSTVTALATARQNHAKIQPQADPLDPLEVAKAEKAEREAKAERAERAERAVAAMMITVKKSMTKRRYRTQCH